MIGLKLAPAGLGATATAAKVSLAGDGDGILAIICGLGPFLSTDPSSSSTMTKTSAAVHAQPTWPDANAGLPQERRLSSLVSLSKAPTLWVDI
jgi:hypothetical protein